jgi:hypothetical protein
MDLGHLHGPLICAGIVQVTAIFLTAQCKEYWQFVLCQGLALGVRAVLSLLARLYWCSRSGILGYRLFQFFSVIASRLLSRHETLTQLGAGFGFGPTLAVVAQWCESYYELVKFDR